MKETLQFFFTIFLPQDSDDYVKKNVATLIREIAKHNPEVMAVSAWYHWPSCEFSFTQGVLDILQLSQLIVNAGGVAAVVDYVGETQGNVRLPGVMMLGYVAAHSENLAMAVIVSKVILGWNAEQYSQTRKTVISHSYHSAYKFHITCITTYRIRPNFRGA